MDGPVVVFENGSSVCRVGFAGEDAPIAVFPNVIAPRQGDHDEEYVGEEAVSSRFAGKIL